MDRFLKCSWAAFALAGAACFSVITYKAAKIPQVPDVTPLIHHGDGVLTRLEGIESKANATLINLDRATAIWAGSASDQAATVKTLAQNAVITLQEARGAIGEVHVAVSTANEQEAHIGPLLDSLKTTSDSAQPVLGQLALTTAASTRAIDALNGRIRDPKIDELMDHIRGMSASGDSMLADAAYKTHQILHPDKKKLTFGAAIWAGLMKVHQLEPPIF